jgi:hypothetical protein
MLGWKTNYQIFEIIEFSNLNHCFQQSTISNYLKPPQASSSS